MKITTVGLGPGSMDFLSYGVLKALGKPKEKMIMLRTKHHPIVKDLEEEGYEFISLDYFYEKSQSFDIVYEDIANYVIEEARKHREVVYAVPGHPRVAEKTVELIESKLLEGEEMEVIASMSFVDAMFQALGFDPVGGFSLKDAFEITKSRINPMEHLIITQVYSQFLASDVKLKLMEYYEDDHKVKLIKAAGIEGQEEILEVPIYELDRCVDFYDPLTSLYVPRLKEEKRYGIEKLREIMRQLRDKENGCPWDLKQTHQTLKMSLIEEAYEVVDAIERDDIDDLIEELGDLLLQVVFHTQLGEEEGFLEFSEVTDGICRKLIRRHPHVFKSKTGKDVEEVLKKWDEIKKEEKSETTVAESMERIPVFFPSLMKAFKIQEKAAKVGFDWDDIKDVRKKVIEEFDEIVDAESFGNIQYIEEELGDLLFAVVNWARFLKVEPEEALSKACKKFLKRFKKVEDKAMKMGKKLEEMSLEEMDMLWEKAKEEEL